uniref:Male flower-specific protein 1 n=1 Tax=Silene latifolia TaxID=37657 RepID=Q3C1D0_SILLA|nr:male flower-specific protein 1 [Silene latifolia]
MEVIYYLRGEVGNYYPLMDRLLHYLPVASLWGVQWLQLHPQRYVKFSAKI